MFLFGPTALQLTIKSNWTQFAKSYKPIKTTRPNRDSYLVPLCRPRDEDLIVSLSVLTTCYFPFYYYCLIHHEHDKNIVLVFLVGTIMDVVEMLDLYVSWFAIVTDQDLSGASLLSKQQGQIETVTLYPCVAQGTKI
jgi:hypothetical protein